MIKNKEYIYLIVSSTISCIVQYYILSGSHKTGRENWPYVFIVSLIMFVIANQLYKLSQRRLFCFFIIVIMCFVPFLMYSLVEWIYFSASFFNTINTDALFYFCSVSFLTGGWVFSVCLILNANYRKKLAERDNRTIRKNKNKKKI